MAVETVTRIKCDRCKNVVEETAGASDTNRESKPIIYVEQKDNPPIKFDDLCAKCSDRVDNLCKQLRLEKDEPAKPAAAPTESKKDAKANKDSKKDKGSERETRPSN
jgi:hypothetical protein